MDTMPKNSKFTFKTANIHFGAGIVKQVANFAKDLGATRVLVVNDGRPGGDRPLIEALQAAEMPYVVISQKGEPDTESVKTGVAIAVKEKVDCVIGLGGGSAIDSAKAVAALVTNGGDPLDYMEVIGSGKKIVIPSLPYIAVPTTSGTGAEVSKNAVLSSKKHGVKVSLRSPHMVPDIALVDPELTLSVPPHVTATCGLDALCHCFESYVSHLATPASDGFAAEGIRRAGRSLRRAYADGSDLSARTDMSLASLCGGVSLANAKLGAAHGFAGPLGGMFGGPHGAVVAALFGASVRVTVRALRQRGGFAEASPGAALRKFTEAARLLTGRADAVAEDAAEWVQEACAAMAVPGLDKWGVTDADALPGSALVSFAMKSSSMRGNPVRLTAQEAAEIVAASLRPQKEQQQQQKQQQQQQKQQQQKQQQQKQQQQRTREIDAQAPAQRHVLAVMKFQPESAGRVLPLLRTLQAKSLEEPGVLEYRILQQGSDSGDGLEFWFTERYRDAAALRSHGASPHFRDASRRLKPILREKPVVQTQLMPMMSCAL